MGNEGRSELMQLSKLMGDNPPLKPGKISPDTLLEAHLTVLFERLAARVLLPQTAPTAKDEERQLQFLRVSQDPFSSPTLGKQLTSPGWGAFFARFLIHFVKGLAFGTGIVMCDHLLAVLFLRNRNNM